MTVLKIVKDWIFHEVRNEEAQLCHGPSVYQSQHRFETTSWAVAKNLLEILYIHTKYLNFSVRPDILWIVRVRSYQIRCFQKSLTGNYMILRPSNQHSAATPYHEKEIKWNKPLRIPLHQLHFWFLGAQNCPNNLHPIIRLARSKRRLQVELTSMIWKNPTLRTTTLWLCQNSYGKWPFIVDFPVKNGDFP